MHLSEVSSANAMFPAFQLIHPTRFAMICAEPQFAWTPGWPTAAKATTVEFQAMQQGLV